MFFYFFTPHRQTRKLVFQSRSIPFWFQNCSNHSTAEKAQPRPNPTNPANYRPISNLNNISKIIERLFRFRFRPFITSSPLFNPNQSAYRQGYSTETALLFTLNNIRQSADRGKSTILVSLDLSSSFDTIDHHLLLERLRTMFAVNGPALNWLRSYLTDRTQLVKHGDDLSAPMLLHGSSGFSSRADSFHILHFTCPLHRHTVWGPSTTICRWYPAVHGNFIRSIWSRSH